ncbi:hypothetical protein HELRODRAFT_170948 [Helobdella robusta]|uniref:CFA20 domain-containing protein n=1 Tax=Helobdella robusta TaxID=6412 RepID=T1F3M3_HELRO|nr:hypothetical protein HELRODRAFT_170948 [Helobdella robusta]ESO06913.1 hypothetical protein HELRODRAFT_170948 [Helobdella robusta]
MEPAEEKTLIISHQSSSAEKSGKSNSVFRSDRANLLDNWLKKTSKNGSVKLVNDDVLMANVLEITGSCSGAYIHYTNPDMDASNLATAPYLCLILRNIKKHFSLEVCFVDDMNLRRRIRMDTTAEQPSLKNFLATLPLKLTDTITTKQDWNYLCLDMESLAATLFRAKYVRTLKIRMFITNFHRFTQTAGCIGFISTKPNA